VRRDAGMFDVSHMCVIDLEGAGVRALLERLLANDVDKLQAPGKAALHLHAARVGRHHRRPHRLLPRRELVPAWSWNAGTRRPRTSPGSRRSPARPAVQRCASARTSR